MCVCGRLPCHVDGPFDTSPCPLQPAVLRGLEVRDQTALHTANHAHISTPKRCKDHKGISRISPRSRPSRFHSARDEEGPACLSFTPVPTCSSASSRAILHTMRSLRSSSSSCVCSSRHAYRHPHIRQSRITHTGAWIKNQHPSRQGSSPPAYLALVAHARGREVSDLWNGVAEGRMLLTEGLAAVSAVVPIPRHPEAVPTPRAALAASREDTQGLR